MHRRNFIFGSLAASVAGIVTGRKREAVAEVTVIKPPLPASQPRLIDLQTRESEANNRYPFRIVAEMSEYGKSGFFLQLMRMIQTINRDSFAGFASGCLRCESFSSVRVIDNLWEITIDFLGYSGMVLGSQPFTTSVFDGDSIRRINFYCKADFSCFDRFFDGLEIVPVEMRGMRIGDRLYSEKEIRELQDRL